MPLKGFSALALLAALLLGGCASMEAHDTKVGASMQTLGSGDVNGSIAKLDEGMKADSDRKGLLYNLEKGELLRIANRYDESLERFGTADAIVKEWEETASKNPEKLLGTVGAALISERLKSYEGQDYEKVMLTVRMAQDRLSKGDFDQARVDIKRTHEREAIIQAFRSKETLAAEEEAKAKGVKTTSKELSGYPVESLNDPEVLALRNGYANAFGHYISGYLYEALNEPDLAAPGYRKAIELRPGAPLLQNALKGLDSRAAAYGRRTQTDVLFVVESGMAPARESKMFTLPIPTRNGIVAASLAYPVIKPGDRSSLLQTVTIAGKRVTLEKVTDFNVMARRALKDEMPGMMLRATIRLIAKGVMQDQMAKNFGLIGNIVGAVAATATEGADDRLWRGLPERIEVARVEMPPGKYNVRVGSLVLPDQIEVSGAFMIVPIRIIDSRPYVGEMARFGKVIKTADAHQAQPNARKPAGRAKAL